MAYTFCLPAAGTLGNDKGGAADGVLVGSLTATNPSKVILKSVSSPALCFTDDGGLYVDETAALASATTDDVEVLPGTPAAEDACYFGHATAQFDLLTLVISTQGAGDWTIAWEYWDGSEWAALADVVDGTTGFTAAAGTVTVAYTLPEDWAKNTVDSVNAYWIRARVSVYTSVSTAPQVAQGYVTTVDPVYTDDTTDATDADAGDVALLPTFPSVGDAVFYGYSARFCKLKITTSQARTGTATITPKYWNSSEWTALTVVDDDSVGYSATAGTHYIHFAPPTDWVANTAANGPNGEAGYFISMELTALTSVTQQPLATRAWVLPLTVGSGVTVPVSGTATVIDMTASTISGTTADSKFIVVNVTSGSWSMFTWTKATANDREAINVLLNAGDSVALVQITEDGTTEFANAAFWLCL